MAVAPRPLLLQLRAIVSSQTLAGSRVGAACMALALITPHPGRAEIHDYMILRLVHLNTSCGTDALERIEAGPDLRRFKVRCRNESTYPNGLTVTCTDIDDDRSCRVETSAKEFKDLRLLQPGPDGPQ